MHKQGISMRTQKRPRTYLDTWSGRSRLALLRLAVPSSNMTSVTHPRVSGLSVAAGDESTLAYWPEPAKLAPSSSMPGLASDMRSLM